MVDSVTNIAMFVAGLACLILFVHSIHKEPRRISCGVLLVLAIYLTLYGGVHALWPDVITPDDSLIVGKGSEIFMLATFAFMLVSFVGGIALIVNGIKLIRREGASLAHALPVLFGVAGIGWPFLFGISVFIPHITPLVMTVWSVMMYVPGMLAAVLLYSFVYALLPKQKDYDFIVVLGSGLKDGRTVTPLLANRLKRAIRLYRDEGEYAVFVVSGGKGSDEKASEALAMKRYLLERGIPEKRIVMEDQSRNTDENIRFSKKIMDRAKSSYKCAIATSNYHVLRAVVLAKNGGLAADGIGGNVAFYYLPAAFIREYIAMVFDYKNLALAYVAAVVVYNILQVVFGL